MDRLSFLKSIGISVLSPMVLTVYSEGKCSNMKVGKFKPKRWPIYPDKTQFSWLGSNNEMGSEIFTYVKIKQDGVEYLVPVKETAVGSMEWYIQKRFEYNVNLVQENYIIDQSQVDNGWVIKYNKTIHNN